MEIIANQQLLQREKVTTILCLLFRMITKGIVNTFLAQAKPAEIDRKLACLIETLG